MFVMNVAKKRGYQMFDSPEHKINYLLKENREAMEKIVGLLQEISNNQRELVRMYYELKGVDVK